MKKGGSVDKIRNEKRRAMEDKDVKRLCVVCVCFCLCKFVFPCNNDMVFRNETLFLPSRLFLPNLTSFFIFLWAGGCGRPVPRPPGFLHH